MTESSVLAFVVAALAVPGVTSLLTSALRLVGDALNVDPRVVVYVASIAVTGVILASGGIALPPWAGDGPTYIAAWLTLATANAEMARRVYELLLSKLYPSPA
mgnify:CR=1 FL=1